MYNLEREFKKFYRNHVVLPRSETDKLYGYRKLNIDRLKAGLADYNEENGTTYSLKDNVVQGSVAMATIVQNEENDYDIDVAIIFNKSELPEGTTATKNIIVDALKRKCGQFKCEPEFKTNCVRISYADGYQVDFAIYRRSLNSANEYEYEHCGSVWRPRNPRDITNWFHERNEEKGFELRKIVRLLKMFCSSNSSWVMPAGLIQSVLANECFVDAYRLDEMFYYTIKAVRDRLSTNKDVLNPVDSTQSLLLISKDDDKIKNLYSRLDAAIKGLDILFDASCTEAQAKEAWENFFSHSYWEAEANAVTKMASVYDESLEGNDEEEFIDSLYPVRNQYQVAIDCEVKTTSKTRLLRSMLYRRETVPIGAQLIFKVMSTDVPRPYSVLWKVRNSGQLAERNGIRCEIFRSVRFGRNKTEDSITETSSFGGGHYVECYIIKNKVCVAKTRIDVPIG